MGDYKFNWERASKSDEAFKKEMEYFRERNGIRPGSGPKPNYKDHLWPAEVEERLRIGDKTEWPRLFYLEEEGDLLQNEMIIEAAANLKSGKTLSQDVVARILADPTPVLQFKAVKVEVVAYDLFKTAVESRKKSLVEQLLPYVNLTDYDRKDRERIMELLKELELFSD